jgi:hypothetical protein
MKPPASQDRKKQIREGSPTNLRDTFLNCDDTNRRGSGVDRCGPHRA